VDLGFILAKLPLSREPVFYDAFLRISGDELFPVPVKVTNLDAATGNNNPNQGVRVCTCVRARVCVRVCVCV